jgi:hypothetical protein
MNMIPTKAFAKVALSLILSLFISAVQAQFCDEDFILETQTDVDNFIIENADCLAMSSSLSGSISIRINNSNPDQIISLDGFENITEILGGLYIIDETIAGALPVSIEGLQNIYFVDSLVIECRVALTDLTGLEGLVLIGSLIDISLMENSLSMAPISNISGAYNIVLRGNSNISFVEVLPNLSGQISSFSLLSTDGGIAEFAGFNSLNSCVNFVVGSYYTSDITIGYFDAFHNVEYIGSMDMSATINFYFMGFENLFTVDFFRVNIVISDEVNFNSLTTITQEINLYGNYSGGIVFDVLNHVDYVQLEIGSGSIYFPALQSSLSISFLLCGGSGPVAFEFQALETVNDLQISGCQFTDLNFLSSLYSVNNVLVIAQNPLLTSCSINAVCDRLALNTIDVSIYSNNIGCESIEEVANSCGAATVGGKVYIDYNCSGTLDAEDQLMDNVLLTNSDGLPITSTDGNGNYSFILVPNTTLVYVPTSNYLLFDASPISIENGDQVQNLSNYNFGFCPDYSTSNMQVAVAASNLSRPGFTSQFYVTISNSGPYPNDGEVTLDYTNMFGSVPVDSNIYFGIVTDSTWYYNFVNFPAYASQTFIIEFTTPINAPLDSIQILTVGISIDNLNESDISDNTAIWTGVITGSYDPNDITVNKPAIEYSTYQSQDENWLEYVIRFQNTGNAEAIFINVDNEIDEKLDMSTLQMIYASHSYFLSFDNRKASWFFDNIMLPDSTSDPEGSKGLIHFRIKMISDLLLNDVLESTAAIYFDYNEPVITNTATTVLYECPDAFAIDAPATACSDETLVINGSGGYESYNWIVNGDPSGNSQGISLENILAGQYEVMCLANTLYCSSGALHTIVVNSVPETPDIIQNGNTLVASGSGTFIWTLNGVALLENSNTLGILESGNYGVMVTQNGCESNTSSNNFTYIGVTEENIKAFNIYPNPASDRVILELAVLNTNSEMFICNSHGELVRGVKLTGQKTILFDVDDLPSGIYFARIGTYHQRFVVQK